MLGSFTQSLRRNACSLRGLRSFSTNNFKKNYASMRDMHNAHTSTPLLQSSQVVNVLSVPLHHGQPRDGVETGPAMMKSQRLFEKIRETGFVVDDMGDVKVDPVNVARPADGSMCLVRAKAIGDACKNVAEIVAENTMKGNFQLTLGGDHSIAIGSIAGKLMAQPELGVIWVDAHADINTVKTSDSQNIHGMAVAFLLGLADTNVPGFEWLGDVPNLLKERLVYIGLRDVDAGESVLIKKHGIKAYTMHEIDRYGIGQVMDMAIDHVTNRVDRPLHISYDIDSVDPEFAQATGTKVYGGLTYREAFYVAESVANTGLLTSLDMVEVNPYLATDEELFTVNLANNIVTAALGKKIM